jgi:hypothetical protein
MTVKIGDEVAINKGYHPYNIYVLSKITKVTPSGKFRTEQMPNLLWRCNHEDGAHASFYNLIFVTEENKNKIVENINQQRRLKIFKNSIHYLSTAQIKPEQITDELIGHLISALKIMGKDN